MWFKPFTRRHKKPPEIYTYEISMLVRSRIIRSLQQLLNNASFNYLVNQVEKDLLSQYGFLCEPTGPDRFRDWPEALRHFLSCEDEQILDFLEYLFHYCTQFVNGAVNIVNEIFREEGVGFEFTHCTYAEIPPPQTDSSGAPRSKQIREDRIEILYPIAIKKDNELIHKEIIEPCLNFLAHPDMKTANKEMLDAYEDYRKGKFDSSVSRCLQSFESVLKTVCTKNKWAHDPKKDACARLVEICKINGLVPDFYEGCLVAVGTIRSKIGTAHGRGNVPIHGPATQDQASHYLAFTASNILLIARLAGY